MDCLPSKPINIITKQVEIPKKIPNIVRTITDLKLKNVIKIKMVNKKETDKVYISLPKEWEQKPDKKESK